MGYRIFSEDDYRKSKATFGITRDVDVTRHAENQARITGKLNEIVDPAVNPIRRSMIRLNPHLKKWIATLGCPMDIEVNCDTTGSMGGEVDTEMAVLPDLCGAVALVLEGYDPQLCLGIFGDVVDQFVLCRPQFEMTAEKIVEYLKEMAPQRNGGDSAEDPQYAMFARAYLTDAYTNKIGLKGYHFIVTDAICHEDISRRQIMRIFGENIFENELKNMTTTPRIEDVIAELKKKTHQFILVLDDPSTARFWRRLCGDKSVVEINSTKELPAVISAIIGLTEGTLDITDVEAHLRKVLDIQGHARDNYLNELARHVSNIDICAQLKLRHAMEHPVPVVGDIFENKEDIWPSMHGDIPSDGFSAEDVTESDTIQYL